MIDKNPYRARGTLVGRSYIEREADTALQEAIRYNDKYPFFLAPRQSGKSSVIEYTRRALASNQLRFAIVDLSVFPRKIMADYDKFLVFFVDVIFKKVNASRSLQHRLTQLRDEIFFLSESLNLLLENQTKRFVICIDEVDALLIANFKDDFLSQIRALFNERASNPSFWRLQFVLAGAATRDSLISDPKRSPFNVGEQILLEDLDLKRIEDLVAIAGLKQNVIQEAALRLEFWTNGSVFLCQYILEKAYRNGLKDESDVRNLIDKTVETIVHKAPHDIHFTNIKKRMTENWPLLSAWRDWNDGSRPRDVVRERLSLIGISDYQKLYRNRIYERVFGIGGPLNLILDTVITFTYDVFLSHSSTDKALVRPLAERLRQDGLRVWLDEWAIQPGDIIGLKVQQGMEQSRMLIMCMSPAYFKSDWVTLEHHTLLFRDPTNTQRRFIPLFIADCDPPDAIAQFRYVDWRVPSDEAYDKLLTICRRDVQTAVDVAVKEDLTVLQPTVFSEHEGLVLDVAVTPDARRVVSTSEDGTIRVWDLKYSQCIATLVDGNYAVNAVALTPNGKWAVSGSSDKMLRVWDLENGKCVAILHGHSDSVNAVAITPDGKKIISGSADTTLRVWDLKTGQCLATLEGHAGNIWYWAVTITPDGKRIISGSADATLKVWNLESGQCLDTLEGHAAEVFGLAVTPDGKKVISSSSDRTIRVWDIASGTCIATLEGHLQATLAVKVTPDGKRVISSSRDTTLKVWDLDSGQCLDTLKGHTGFVYGIAITPTGKKVVSGSRDCTLRVWDISDIDTRTTASDAPRYTNAKVVLVGESGVGKTGLALRLAEDRWQETGSTHGMNVWPLDLPETEASGMEREVWLWDFAGQPDYRLIHQLYMDETALALMVIDPQRDDPFEPLGHWEKALRAAVKHDPARLLVAARCDRGGLTISQGRMEQHRRERGYSAFLSTAAKTGDGCADLKEAIAACIPWERLPWTATTRLFKTLKDAIVRIKAEGVVLARVSELAQRLRLELQDETIEEDKLRAVVGLLAGQGLIQKLDFGDFVLLQLEQINNYGSAVVRSARESSDELGVVPERAVMEAELDFKDMQRLDEADEKILLRAMLQIFLDRSLCARVETDQGAQLVFPSYFKLDRPDIPDQPNVVVTYGFTGTLDEIYSTLVVRLHYTAPFEMGELWRYAADFRTVGDKRVGLQMSKQKGDAAEIQVYFGPGTHLDTQVAFIKYIHEHLRKHAQDVTRVRSYVCPYCDTPLENRQAIKKRLELGKTDILCGMCEERVGLIDLIEQKFTSGRFVRAVQEMDAQAQINLDSESRELILVGHAEATATEAGQIFRAVALAEWGIDGEIEFKDHRGRPGGRRVYLQLKTGDAYHHRRKRDDAETFTIKDPRQAEYWLAQASPVMLVTRAANGQIRWMNVTDHLRGRDTAAWLDRLNELRKTLAKHFDAEELRTFCFDLGVSYDDLPAQGNAAKARELISHLERRNRIPTLERIGEQLHPDISWGDAAPVPSEWSQPIIFAGEPFTALNVVRLRSRVLDRP